MEEVIIVFEPDGAEGSVAVGTYLIDAGKRLGIAVDDGCLRDGEEHNCVMKISAGMELLSPLTSVEMELLSGPARKNGERLSCQTKIEKPGEVSVMTVKKEEKAAQEKEEPEASEQYKKEFEELPLEKKIASLVELEAIALGETFSYVLNSPSAVIGKVMDVMAEFGMDLDKKAREAKRPGEHKKKDDPDKKSRKKGSGAKAGKRGAAGPSGKGAGRGGKKGGSAASDNKPGSGG